MPQLFALRNKLSRPRASQCQDRHTSCLTCLPHDRCRRTPCGSACISRQENAIPAGMATVSYPTIFDYLVFNRTDVYDETFFNEIKRIPKGHFGYFRAGRLELTPWWTPHAYVRERNTGSPEHDLPTDRGDPGFRRWSAHAERRAGGLMSRWRSKIQQSSSASSTATTAQTAIFVPSPRLFPGGRSMRSATSTGSNKGMTLSITGLIRQPRAPAKIFGILSMSMTNRRPAPHSIPSTRSCGLPGRTA